MKIARVMIVAVWSTITVGAIMWGVAQSKHVALQQKISEDMFIQYDDKIDSLNLEIEKRDQVIFELDQ